MFGKVESPANIAEAGSDRVMDQFGVSYSKTRMAEELAMLEALVLIKA